MTGNSHSNDRETRATMSRKSAACLTSFRKRKLASDNGGGWHCDFKERRNEKRRREKTRKDFN